MLQQVNHPNCLDHTRHLQTPVLAIDLVQLRDNLRQIRQALPQCALFYAVKCNSALRVLETVQHMEVGFEIASIQEAETALKLGVPPEKIFCLHPIKSPDFLRFLHRHGIDVLAADSVHELDKIAEHAPGSRVVIRVSVPNEGSVVPLTRKYGVEPKDVVKHFHLARERGLVPHGITLHVGSQCERLATWQSALEICEQLYQEASDAGIGLSLISLGGGLPVAYAKDSLSLAAIGEVVGESISRMQLPPDCMVSVEPGRAVAASAGIFISTVIGLAERADGMWAYIDAGVFHGLFEASRAGGRIPYPIVATHTDHPMQVYNIGGPTCDSFDLPFEQLSLPELHIGDRLAIHFAGAYSTAMSSTFNGFPVPAIHYLENAIH